MRKPPISPTDRYLFNISNIIKHLTGKSFCNNFHTAITNRIKNNLENNFLHEPERQLTPVDRRGDLTIEEFKNDYVGKKPVVWKGAGKSWDCVNKWSHELFIKNYGDDQTLVINNPKGNAGILEYEYLSLATAINKLLIDPSVNIRFNPLLYSHPELIEDIPLTWFKERQSAVHPYIQIQMFIAGYSSSTHIHAAMSENLYAMIKGRKRWVLYHPNTSPIFRPNIERTPYFFSDLDHNQPDMNEYPYFNKIPGWVCDLEEGDVLYHPCFFWHFVTSLSPSIAVGYRWVNPLNVVKLSPVLGILSFLATNPPFWVTSKYQEDFSKIVAHKRNKRSKLKS